MSACIHARPSRVNMYAYIMVEILGIRSEKMPVTLRLTKEEQRNTELKCREINKVLINIEKSPMQESELLHLVIELALSRIKINKKGEIDLE